MICDKCGNEIKEKFFFTTSDKKKNVCYGCMKKAFTQPMVNDKGEKVGDVFIEKNYGQSLINREYLRKHKVKQIGLIIPQEDFDTIMEAKL